VSSAPFEVAVGRTARGIWKCKYFIEINKKRVNSEKERRLCDDKENTSSKMYIFY